MVQILQSFGVIWDKFTLNLVLVYHQSLKNYAETAPFNGEIWDEFIEQH